MQRRGPLTRSLPLAAGVRAGWLQVHGGGFSGLVLRQRALLGADGAPPTTSHGGSGEGDASPCGACLREAAARLRRRDASRQHDASASARDGVLT